MKIFSWNVNGIRAVIRKGDFGSFIEKYDPDIFCMQETKAEQGQAEVDRGIEGDRARPRPLAQRSDPSGTPSTATALAQR